MNIREAHPTSFGDLTFGTDYRARIPEGVAPLGAASIVEVSRSDDFPVFSKKLQQSRTLALTIEILDGGSGTIDELLAAFDPYDPSDHAFVVTDDSDVDWYVMAVVQEPGELYATTLRVNLYIADPIWRTVEEDSETANLTASGQTLVCTPSGNKYARPRITLRPTSPRTGSWSYRRWVPIINPDKKKFTRYPLDISGAWDTAALVSGGKMQADGDDLRVIVDGDEVDRWFGGGGINSATTRVWINLNLSPAKQLTLSGSIAGTGAVSSITLKNTTFNKLALKALKQATNKILLIGSEAFVWERIDVATRKFLGVTRAQRYTSMAAHSDGDYVNWVEHDIFVIYGNSTATAPSVDDTKKPLLDLTNSTNASWVWTDFYDADYTDRPASWSPKVKASDNPDPDGTVFYTADDIGFANPASEMGMVMRCFQLAGVWKGETAKLHWALADPVGFTEFTYSGEKYRYGGAAHWPTRVALRKSSDGGQTWTTVLKEASPADTQVWESFTRTSQALGGTFRNVMFEMAGSIPKLASSYAAVEFDSITGVKGANIPTVTFGSENSTGGTHEEVTITNSATGEWISFGFEMLVSSEIEIDTDAKRVRYRETATDTAVDIPNVLVLSPSTQGDDRLLEWLRLLPGEANTLTIDETGLVALTITVEWEARSL